MTLLLHRVSAGKHQQAHNAIITSPLRQNDVATLFWRHNCVVCPLGCHFHECATILITFNTFSKVTSSKYPINNKNCNHWNYLIHAGQWHRISNLLRLSQRRVFKNGYRSIGYNLGHSKIKFPSNSHNTDHDKERMQESLTSFSLLKQLLGSFNSNCMVFVHFCDDFVDLNCLFLGFTFSREIHGDI